MKLSKRFFKAYRFLGLPLWLCGLTALIAYKPVYSQTNQSDITGPNITSTVINKSTSTTTVITQTGTTTTTTTQSGTTTNNQSGTTTTNQSDITGPKPPGPINTNQSDITGGKTTTSSGSIITKITIRSVLILPGELTANAAGESGDGSGQTSEATTPPAPSPVTPSQTGTPGAGEPKPPSGQTPSGVGTQNPPPPGAQNPPPPVAQNPPPAGTPGQKPPVAQPQKPPAPSQPQTNQSDATGPMVKPPKPQTNQSDTTGPIPQPVVQNLDITFGNRRILVILPSSRNPLRGNAGQVALGGLKNLGELRRARILSVWSWGSRGAILIRIGGQRILLALEGLSPGSSQASPILPNRMGSGRFTFVGVVTGAWVDPPTTEGFRYTMTSDSLFTKIEEFPTGLGDSFTVSVDGKVVGDYRPGDKVDFTNFPGGGVKEFTVTGLDPLAEPNNPIAFPLKLAFNTEKADFTMEALEDPEAVRAFAENPPPAEPFTIAIQQEGSQMELVPTTTLQVLREQMAKLSSSLANASELSASVAAVEKDLDSLSSDFQGLLPESGGVNVSVLNPTMDSANRLRRSLPMLLQELSASQKKASPEQVAAIATMVKEVEGLTTLLEAMTPMLSQMSEAVAVAK